jgi:hypothetical protein
VRSAIPWAPGLDEGHDDGMMTTTLRRWALPVGLVAVVLGSSALGPLVQAAADDVPEPSEAEILTLLLGADLDGFSGTVATHAELGLPELPAGLGGTEDTSWLGLLTGDRTLRTWASADGVRIALLGDLTESDLVVADGEGWLWSSQESTATRLSVSGDVLGAVGEGAGEASEDAPADDPAGGNAGDDPAGEGSGDDPAGGNAGDDPAGEGSGDDDPGTTTDAAIPLLGSLADLAGSSTMTVGPSTSVAGRAAYQLVIAPTSSETLIGSVRVAIDAEEGLPLRVQVFPRDSDSPAIEIGFTRVALEPPDPGVFDFTPPPGATVEGTSDDDAEAGDAAGLTEGWTVVGEGWTAVVVGPAPDLGGTDGAPSTLEQLAQVLPQVSGPWGSGRLLTSRVLSVLLTDDGRLLAGAVSGEHLQEVAAELAGSGPAS